VVYLPRQQAVVPQGVIIAGYPNFHRDDSTDADARQFTEMLDVYGLVLHVTGVTHIHGHTLDVLSPR